MVGPTPPLSRNQQGDPNTQTYNNVIQGLADQAIFRADYVFADDYLFTFGNIKELKPCPPFSLYNSLPP